MPATFKNVLYATLYRGLLSDTMANPCNILTDIIEHHLKLSPNMEQYRAAIVEQLRNNKNVFHNIDMLNDVCRTVAVFKNMELGINIDVLSQYIADNIFHYSSFIEEYNLLLCKQALLMLDDNQYKIITESSAFLDGVVALIWDNVQDQLMRKRRDYDSFIDKEVSKLSEEEKLINKQFYLTNE